MLEIFKDIARVAADEILAVYNSKEAQSTEDKSDGSPLTLADSRAHHVIAQRLSAAFPATPILSEEGRHASWDERKKWHRFLLIDPLDGTREFIKRNGDFTVNIALIEGGVPIAGIVHVPVSGVSYVAEKGKGAFKVEGDRTTRLTVSVPEAAKPIRVVGSRSHASEELGAFLRLIPGAELASRGSALKLCLVAEGSADVYPRHGPTSLWDIAAGHCVIAEAGGYVCDAKGDDLSYGLIESLKNPAFVAGAFNRERMAALFAQSICSPSR